MTGRDEGASSRIPPGSPYEAVLASLQVRRSTRARTRVQEEGRDVSTAELYRAVGEVTHAAVCSLLSDGLAGTGAQIDRAVRTAMKSSSRPIPSPIPVRVMAHSLVFVYLIRLRPIEAELIGAEELLPDGSRCDLVWWHPDPGYCTVDELKTGTPSVPFNGPSKQVQRYLDHGAKWFGAPLKWVRVCYLRAPHLTTIFCPNGDWIPGDGR